MEKYFEQHFNSIPVDYSKISYADVWETNRFVLNGKVVNVNRFGFDPNDAYTYFHDEHWYYSDDYSVRNKAQDTIARQQELVKVFQHNNQPLPEYTYIKGYSPIKTKVDVDRYEINAKINRWSIQHPWRYEAENEYGKFLVYMLSRHDNWKPGREINEVKTLTIVEHRLYDINGEKVVEVVCY